MPCRSCVFRWRKFGRSPLETAPKQPWHKSTTITYYLILAICRECISESSKILISFTVFRDRIRSTSSVVSHTFCTAVVYSLCKKDLEKIDEKHHVSHLERDQTELSIIVEANGTDTKKISDTPAYSPSSDSNV